MAPRACRALEVRANLLGFVLFNRAGVSLSLTQAKLSQYVKNLTALDFQFSREIVDSNLAHPPLFKFATQSPLVAHSYLMALAACGTSIIP
jgi:hypothetical protein